MLLDPGHVVGHVSVDSGLVAVTTAGAPADDASQGELCSSFLTYQRTPGVTLSGGQTARGSCPIGNRQGARYQPDPKADLAGVGASLQEASAKHPGKDGVSMHV